MWFDDDASFLERSCRGFVVLLLLLLFFFLMFLLLDSLPRTSSLSSSMVIGTRPLFFFFFPSSLSFCMLEVVTFVFLDNYVNFGLMILMVLRNFG
ncbi:hypothetical protein DFH27DRAFT_539568 [Peziza echinospora]|nr:hypothetical protein DFH27DRAFT_539568 [Peziza echinospora]